MHQFFRAVVRHFQSHAVTEAPAQQLAAQGGGQIFKVVFQFKVGVAGQAELIAAFHLHAWEELIGMGVNHGGQEHQVVATVTDVIRKPDQTRQRTWRRHDGHPGFATEGILTVQLNNEVQAFVDQARERVGRVQPDGADHRQDFLFEVTAHPVGLSFRPFTTPDEVNVFLLHLGDQHVVQDVVLFPDVLVGHPADFAQHLLRHHAVGAQGFTAILDLLAQARHPDLEELVHVAAENAAEHQPVNQRMRGIQSLFEHPVVELKLAQFAVEIVFLGGDINFHAGGWCFHGSRHVRNIDSL